MEFALATALLCVLVLGAVEMARLMWTVNAAVEATRLGARLAAVCDMHDSRIAQRMTQVMPALPEQAVVLDYLDPPLPDNTCTPSTCKAVRVSLQGVVHQMMLPFSAAVIPLPPLRTTLRRESMDSSAHEACL